MVSFFVSLMVLFGLFIGLFFLFLFISSKISERPKQPSNQDEDSFMQGLVIVFLSHIAYALLVVLISFLLSTLGLWRGLDVVIGPIVFLCFTWVAQLIYVVPLAIFFKTKGKQNTFLGIIVGAGVTFLLGGGLCAVTSLGGR